MLEPKQLLTCREDSNAYLNFVVGQVYLWKNCDACLGHLLSSLIGLVLIKSGMQALPKLFSGAPTRS